MKRLIISAICSVVALLLGVLLVLPEYQSFRIAQANIEVKDTELQYRQEYVSQLNETSQELEKYKETLSKISSALPPEPFLPALFYFLQKTSSETGLVLEEINLAGISAPVAQEGEEKKASEIKDIQVNISLSGSYPDFKNFLSALEKSTRLVEVKDISFSSAEEPEEPLSFQLKIKTHSY